MNSKEGIEKFQLSKNRMEIISFKDITIINDCYNANYDSMKAGIETLSRMEGKRKIAVLGDMLELGNFSKALHSKIGEEIVNNQIDIVITVGEEAQNIVETVLKENVNNINTFSFDSNEQAIQLLEKILKTGDIVLIKASNGMKFTEIVNALIKKWE